MEDRREVPIWPRDGTKTRRMCFLFGEARWYLWFQELNKQAVSKLRRDLLLLHQNGDLELFRGNGPLPSGTYVTALHEGHMIRARVCSAQNKSDPLKSTSKYVQVIDLDEGKILQLPVNQVRVLPVEMTELPCQAIRCDIGLDCTEQFKWPLEINSMLHKVLGEANLFVQICSSRPGSIPTISASVNICDPATGQSMNIQKWLINKFSSHLGICSLDAYKPFPVGMSAEAIEESRGLLQQQVFGMNTPTLLSQSPQGMQPNLQPSLATPMHPSFMPNYQASFQPGMPHTIPHQVHSGMIQSMPPSMQPSISPVIPPLICSSIQSVPGNMPPVVCPNFPARMPIHHQLAGLQPSPHPPMFNQPFSGPSHLGPTSYLPPHPQYLPPGSTVSATMVQYQYRQSPVPGGPNRFGENGQSGPKMPQKGGNFKASTSNSSISSLGYESDTSEDTVGIDLNNSTMSSSSMSSNSSLNPHVAAYVPKKQHIASDTVEKELPATSSLTSSLSVRATPFVPKSPPSSKPKLLDTSRPDFGKPKLPEKSMPKPSDSTGNKLPACNLVNQTKSKKINPAVSIVEKPKSPLNAGPSSDFPKGYDVELPCIARNWKAGQILPALMARVWNPSCFEVNIVDQYSALLESITEEMKSYYKIHKITLSNKNQAQELCGNFCACYDPDDKIWYRGEVEEWFLDDSVVPVRVWAVDYGGVSRVDLGCIQPLMTELACASPVLVTLCSMQNILPHTESNVWPQLHLDRVKELLPEDKELYIRIDGPKSAVEVWPVSVFTDPDCSSQSINETLVAEGCAYYVGTKPQKQPESEDEIHLDAEDPMEEAYNIGGDNYDIDDEDACMAATGRSQTEETGICWFYGKHGYCYKRICHLRHVPLDPDGHSIEKKEIHTKSFEEIGAAFLLPGKCIKLTVTRIMTVNHFIARIHLGKGTPGIKSRETLNSVLENLNSPSLKRSLKAFTEYPVEGEIVLYKDQSGNFFRGRVIGSNDLDENIFEVLNVDTGYHFRVPFQNLRRVDPAFLHHPFQAIECWLADVAPTQSEREWTKTCNAVFADLVKNQKVLATIVRSAPWGIEVNLRDKEGRDFAVLMKEMDIVKSCPRRHLPVDNSSLVPG